MFVYAGADRIGGDGVDVVVLAQASMARVVKAMPKDTLPVPVLSSPELALERARAILAGLAGLAGPAGLAQPGGEAALAGSSRYEARP